ncbi:GNAT family N-acetyltransferase [Pseudaeromonas sharmana]|uniref:GNAT family N-acetyltransferase n=1 Tax=Pseudaeromonas sharmana TaxID=328412 RepID=A0ABV8CQD2_9GAMM
MSVPEIHTARLRLTVLSARDGALLYRYVNNNRAHLAPWEPQRDEAYYTLSACEDRLFVGYQHWLRGDALPWVALHPETGEMVASCHASQISRGAFQACYLGYSIAAEYQGQGLMREVVAGCIDYLFTELRLHRVMANYMPHNHRSARLLTALQFEREGYARQYLQIAGQWQDHVLTARINPYSSG